MNEKLVVLGSNSFSGSHFVAYALQQGAEVVGISRSPEPSAVFLPYKQEKVSGFRFYQLDLNYHLYQIIKIIDDFSPDYVVNFAAQGMVAESWQHPEHWLQTNVVATIRFHDQLRQYAGLKKYVHISTPEVYGSCQGLIQENTNYHPSTPYAVSRTAADMSLMTFWNTYQFPVVFTRAANVYGPGQQLYRIIPRTVLYFLTGRKLQLHGGGHSVRSFIHIQDVVDGTLKVVRQAPPGEIYHFATSRNISIRALVHMIADQLRVSFEEHVEIVGERPGKDAAYLLDSSKAKATLGWNDHISLEQGIAETIWWVQDNLEALKDEPSEYRHKP